MVIRQFVSFIILICWATSVFALDNIQSSVDRNPVVKGEYFVLTVAADDELDAGNLDTSILLKDFIVGRTSVSRSTQIINFDAKRETRWQILLAPKKLGQIMVPAFVIDNVKSNPIPLTVVSSGTVPTAMKNIFIETELSTKEAYVGQLITYKLKLYLALELQRGALSAPVLENAQIRQLGDDKDTHEIVDGRRFRVIERTYAITPDFPGELTISGAGFSGDVLIDSPARAGRFTFNESRPMQAKADKQVILVNPLPSHALGDGLVADLVALKEDWPQQQSFEVGTPITREITLLASNADETSLPDIDQSLPTAFKLYPEKPKRQTIVRDGRLVSQLIQTVAIVPTSEGQFTLPEISVPWWNPHLKRQEIARLPARTISVQASTINQMPNINQSTSVMADSANFWPWLTGLFALLWLGTLGAWFKTRTSNVTSIPNVAATHNTHQQNQTEAQTQTLTAFVRACKQQDATVCLNALQQYMSATTKTPLTLNKIAKQYPDLSPVIEQLQASAYGNQNVTIDYQAIIKLIKQLPVAQMSHRQTELGPLNP